MIIPISLIVIVPVPSSSFLIWLVLVFVSNKFLFVSSILITGLSSSLVSHVLFFSTIVSCFWGFNLFYHPIFNKPLSLANEIFFRAFFICLTCLFLQLWNNLPSLLGNIFENIISNFCVYRHFTTLAFVSFFNHL